MPKNEDDYSFYFKESGKDLKYLIAKCILQAKHSIFISSFGITDKDIVHLIENKPVDIEIKIAYDQKEQNILPNHPNTQLLPYSKSGLMHRKLIGIDSELLLFGSTNLTPLALKIHKNLVVAIRSKKLFSALSNNQSLHTEKVMFFPLPESKQEAFKALLDQINCAKNRIYICIYTFTHFEIGKALIEAKKRGVDIQVYIDRGNAQGTCKKLVTYLLDHQISVSTHLANGLLHHKCALIDDLFAFGSINWTKAAFMKNEEYLLFLNSLSQKELAQINEFFFSVKKSSLPLSSSSVM